MKRLINWIKNRFSRKKTQDYFIGIDMGGAITKGHKEGDFFIIEEIELFEFSVIPLDEKSGDE